jgi:Tfp pilus assembly protein PilP
VRIEMKCKVPPTTSVVVDLEHALGYELTPGPSDKFVLTLHTQAVAKSTPPPTPAKTSAPQAQTAMAKPVVAPPAMTVKTKTAKVAAVAAPPAPKVAKVAAPATPAAPKVAAANLATAPKSTKKSAHAVATKIAAEPAPTAAESADALKLPKPEEKKPEEKKWAMNGKRDPFFSPVVQQVSGSGCSTGKKCLEIGQINVRGVVKADSGFIAVVTNSLNKAYFLHENDPVFNGYVMRITGDSVVFQETVQDKFGKPVTREVTKRIVTPAV